MDAKRVVVLNINEDVLLIVLGPSGVVYKNQTGGVACRHPREEAILVPFNDDPPLDRPDEALSRRLRAVLLDAQHLTAEMADRVDEELERSRFTQCAKVDRSKLDASHEAWVYVKVVDGSNAGFGDLSPCDAVLTWANSD